MDVVSATRTIDVDALPPNLEGMVMDVVVLARMQFAAIELDYA